MKTKGISIRVTQKTLYKLKYIASQKERTINDLVLALVWQDIENFEKKHGKIEGEISPEINAKPPRE